MHALDIARWRVGGRSNGASITLSVLAVLAFVGALPANRLNRERWAFVGTAVVSNASSPPYTLKIMTWAAAIFTPIVLSYQAWTDRVFRRRIGVTDIPPA